jgi:hypothetical protein
MVDYEAPEPYEGSVYDGTDNSDPGFYSDRPEDESIDFRTCPNCGEKLGIASEERLYASNHLKNINVDEDGQLIAAEWGTTEPDWESSTTTFYRCEACMEALPRRYQDVIDAVLHNERESD